MLWDVRTAKGCLMKMQDNGRKKKSGYHRGRNISLSFHPLSFFPHLSSPLSPFLSFPSCFSSPLPSPFPFPCLSLPLPLSLSLSLSLSLPPSLSFSLPLSYFSFFLSSLSLFLSPPLSLALFSLSISFFLSLPLFLGKRYSCFALPHHKTGCKTLIYIFP